MNALRPAGRTVAGLLAITLVLAACSAGAAASGTPRAGPSQSPSSPPDAVVTSPPDGGGGDPGNPGGPVGGFVVPKPGQLDAHPVSIDSFAARVDGTKLVVTATWTSGVEPCNTLDRIVIDPGDHRYTVTLFEGHGAQEIACIMIAQVKKTEFEIPTGGPGTYTIVDGDGHATPLEVTIS